MNGLINPTHYCLIVESTYKVHKQYPSTRTLEPLTKSLLFHSIVPSSCVGSDQYSTLFTEKRTDFLDILHAFPSCSPPLSRLIGMLYPTVIAPLQLQHHWWGSIHFYTPLLIGLVKFMVQCLFSTCRSFAKTSATILLHCKVCGMHLPHLAMHTSYFCRVDSQYFWIYEGHMFEVLFMHHHQKKVSYHTEHAPLKSNSGGITPLFKSVDTQKATRICAWATFWWESDSQHIFLCQRTWKSVYLVKVLLLSVIASREFAAVSMAKGTYYMSAELLLN